MYGRRGGSGRPDTYTCATRYREQSCDEPIYRRPELDREVANKLFFLLNSPKTVDAKIDESLKEDRRAEAQVKVASKERIVADLEKKRKRVLVRIEEEDDPDLGTRLKELNRELAAARHDLATARDEVADVPVIDREALRKQIRQDVMTFRKKSMAEQKAILAKYVKSITAERIDSVDPQTGDSYEPDQPQFHDYNVTLHVKMKVPTGPPDGKGSKDASHRTNSESRCSALWTRFCCALCRTRRPTGWSASRKPARRETGTGFPRPTTNCWRAEPICSRRLPRTFATM